MLELLQTIALLCQVSSVEMPNGKWTKLQQVDDYQITCQKYYIKCTGTGKKLDKCVEERVVE